MIAKFIRNEEPKAPTVGYLGSCAEDTINCFLSVFPHLPLSITMSLESRLQVLSDPIVVAAIVGAITITVIVLKYFSNSSQKNIPPVVDHPDVSSSLKKEEQFSSSGNLLTSENVLSASQFRQFTVLKVTKLSHDSKLIRFELHPDKSLGLKIGRHITVRAEIDGNKVMRSYTPTTRIDQHGYFDLLVKSYEYGKMSTHLTALRVGQRLEVRGPIGRFHYTVNQHPVLGFIAGGTGITPCLQVIRTILECPDYKDDTTQMILFYQNRTEDDILLYNDILTLQTLFPARLATQFFLSNALSTTWGSNATKPNQHKGYISSEMVAQYLQVERCPWVGLCGPSGFNEAMQQLLQGCGGHPADGSSVFVW